VTSETPVATEARVLTDRIKVGVEAIWELIKQAYTERAWATLGYDSWDDYCAREFGTTRLRLPREERAEVVASLRESGLSLRAIASATQVNEITIRRDLDQVRQNVAPEPVVAGPDCKAWCTADGCVCPSDGEPLIDADELADAPARSIGRDGKSYPQQNPQTPRRRPITDTACNLGLDLAKIAKRINKLAADDRLGQNQEAVARELRPYYGELARAQDRLSDSLGTADPYGWPQ
jgi:hypothetical protein